MDDNPNSKGIQAVWEDWGLESNWEGQASSMNSVNIFMKTQQ